MMVSAIAVTVRMNILAESVGGACENTCVKLGEKYYREVEEIRQQQEAGFQKRQQYSNQGMETSREKEQQLAEATADLNVLEVELETLREAKEQAEKPEQEAKQRIEQMQNEMRETISLPLKPLFSQKNLPLAHAEVPGSSEPSKQSQ